MGGLDHLNDALSYAGMSFKGAGDAIRGLETSFIIYDEWSEIENWDHAPPTDNAQICRVQDELESTPGYGIFS